jgi:hypothetical protein
MSITEQARAQKITKTTVGLTSRGPLIVKSEGEVVTDVM